MRRLLLLVLALGLVGPMSGCGHDESTKPPAEQPPENTDPPADTLQARITQFQLAPLPAIPYPRNNRYLAARVRLGRLLFFDPILGGESAPWVKSANGHDPYRYRASDMACGTCHQPALGFADARRLASGVGGGQPEAHSVGTERVAPARSIITGGPVGAVPRNSMTILNTAFNGKYSITPTYDSFQLMDGKVVNGLEFQVFFPLVNRDEMAGDAYGLPVYGDSLSAFAITDSLRRRVAAIPEYLDLYREAFPGRVNKPEDMRADQIFLAIAAYERELITPDSKYDRFVAGQFDAFDSSEKRGFMLFFGKAECGQCHYGPMLCDYTFRVQGTGDAYDKSIPGFAGKNGQGGDFGRFHGIDNSPVPGIYDGKYQFRVMTIRNIDRTAPYFHSGSAASLREVVDFYNRGGRGPEDLSDGTLEAAGAVRDSTIHPLGLTSAEIDDLIAFMKTTTGVPRASADGIDLYTPPDRVPSGLLPPGVPTPEGPGPFYPSKPVRVR